ncbi:MAG: hypothetical protein R3Y58_08395 [Eubacteriales bacterium]
MLEDNTITMSIKMSVKELVKIEIEEMVRCRLFLNQMLREYT